MDGKKAKKKLKASEEAQVVIAPSINPFQKKIATSYTLSPEKPIGLILFPISIINRNIKMLLNSNQNFVQNV